MFRRDQWKRVRFRWVRFYAVDSGIKKQSWMTWSTLGLDSSAVRAWWRIHCGPWFNSQPRHRFFHHYFLVSSCLAVAKGLLILSASTKMYCLYQGSKWFPPDISQALCSKLGGRRHEKKTERQGELHWQYRNSSMLTFGWSAFVYVPSSTSGRCFAAHCRQRKTELTEILHAFTDRGETF